MTTHYILETSVAEIAELLKEKRLLGQHVGILLGHRTGVLYRDNLYKAMILTIKNMKNNLKRSITTDQEIASIERKIWSLSSLSTLNKFKECYNLLDMYFSERGIHNILRDALKFTQCDKEDIYMMKLIGGGFFGTVITTNIDTLFEEASKSLETKGSNENISTSFSSNGDPASAPVPRNIKSEQIISIFGVCDSLEYNTVGHEFDLEANQPLKQFLLSELAKDIIVLGYDPIWDQPIELAFKEQGKKIWYVNEEKLEDNSRLSYVLRHREGKYLVGAQGSYKSFLQALHSHIDETDQGLTVPRTSAFISYSKKDKKYLERLMVHLSGYDNIGYRDEMLNVKDEVWNDRKISPGDDWREEIKKALDSAKVAVFLISADFLSSDFIKKNELPALLEAKRNGEVKVLWVLLGPCAYEQTPLEPVQAVHSVSQPLMNLSKARREEVWKKLANQIVRNLGLLQE